MKKMRIFAEVLEQAARDQFEDAMAQPFAVQGALMPDAHTGYSLPIGAVVATDGVVVPAWVGYDIGCGMCSVPTTFSLEQVVASSQELFADIYRCVPVGFAHSNKDSAWECSHLPHSSMLGGLFNSGARRQIGTLGGGNHFIEIGRDEANVVWITVHSGSRGFGWNVARNYMALASGDGKPREGHFGFPVGSENGLTYIDDLAFCLAFALENRRKIVSTVAEVLARVLGDGYAIWDQLINRNHNHAELKDGLWIHRKGATHAEAGMLGVIPGNMRDGSFIVRGLGNPDSLFSSSHGAGRVLGRKAAQRSLSVEQFEGTMRGIVAKVDAETLDESPFAYKDIFDVMRQQSELVEVLHHVRPLINIKG